MVWYDARRIWLLPKLLFSLLASMQRGFNATVRLQIIIPPNINCRCETSAATYKSFRARASAWNHDAKLPIPVTRAPCRVAG